jgi:hypothetical protein
MVYVQTLRLSDDGPLEDRACSICPSWTELASMVADNPGSTWFIGNEPDRREFQDDVHPDSYARLYHDFYTFLKAEDPTCLVGVGGVVQPTPIRLQYLDLILTAYDSDYGGLMPVDVWNVHIYILKEDPEYPNLWAGIPRGTDDSLAWDHLDLDDHDDPLLFLQLLTAMRQWMADNGYRERPLVVSEMGILMPIDYYDVKFPYPTVRNYMQLTFAYLMLSVDAEIGYPADGNRLAQSWAWYSLDDDMFGGQPNASNLFDPGTRDITNLGLDYADFTGSLTTPFPGSVDLEITGLSTSLPQPDGGGAFEVTLSVDIRNNGAANADNVLVRAERDGLPPDEVVIPSVAAGATESAHLTWSGLALGDLFPVTVTVDPDGQHIDCHPYNNRRARPVLVGGLRLYLPIISH